MDQMIGDSGYSQEQEWIEIDQTNAISIQSPVSVLSQQRIQESHVVHVVDLDLLKM